MERQDRKSFLKGAVLGGVLATTGELFAGEPVRGKVTANGRPMPGVVVTDGRMCAETAANGSFALPGRDGVRFVSVTVPSGWRVPRHYLRFEGAEKSYDFELTPWAPSKKGSFTLMHIGDSEIKDTSQKERAWVARAKAFADERNCAFFVHTGDIASKTGLPCHIKIMNEETVGRPVFYVHGNHDVVFPENGERMFEDYYGPCWYSFDCGNVHFVATPMMWGDGNVSYTDEEIVAWLRNDLAIAARKGQPVILLIHGLDDTGVYDMSGLYGDSQIVTKTFEKLDVTSACDVKGIIHGHLHCNYFRRSKDGKIAVVTVAQPQKSDATLQVVHVDGDGRMLAENRYGHAGAWPVVDDPPQGGWLTRIPGIVGTCDLCVSEGRLFVGTAEVEGRADFGLHALDAKTGRRLWFRKTASSVITRAQARDGRVFVADDDWNVYAFDAKSGEPVWTFDAKSAVGLVVRGKRVGPQGFNLRQMAPITLDEAGARLYFGTYRKALVALDPATGRIVWRAEQKGASYQSTPAAPAAGCGVVVGNRFWLGLYGYDAETGKELWSHERSGAPGLTTAQRYETGVPWLERHGYPVFHGEKLYVHSYDQLLEVEPRTGDVIRSVRLSAQWALKLHTAPVFRGGRIYIGSSRLGLVCIDERTFRVLWNAPVEEAMLVTVPYERPPHRQLASVPVFWKGLVWATCQDGALYAWDPETGERRRRVFTGAPYLASAAVSDDGLYAVDYTGRVRCFR